MRVLHCIASVNPSGGGPIEGIARLAAAMRAQGHSTEVVALDDPADPWVGEYPGVVHAVGRGFGRYRYSPRLVPWLRAHAHSYDVVIANGLWQYNSFGVWRALHGTNVPYAVFPHGMLDPWFRFEYPMKHVKKWMYWPWAEYRVLRDARTVIFTTEEERVLAPRSFSLSRWNSDVIDYGTADPQPLVTEHKTRLLERFQQLRDRRIMLFLGRIHPKKGCDLLVRAFAAQALAKPEWRLVMAGPDATNWRPALEAEAVRLGIADKIVWTGELRGEWKWGAMQAAEVFVLVSHQENFGIAVAEALACGLPVLISDKINIWQEIIKDEAGMVAGDTLDGATELLQRWMAMSREAREVMSQRARDCFLRRFSVTRTATSLVEILRGRGICT